MNDLLVGIGLILVLEGILYAGFPGGLKRMMELARTLPDQTLRQGGLVALTVGFVLIWLIKG